TGRRQARLDEAKALVPSLHTIAGDASDPTAIARLAADVKARFPKLDVLMNNAGVLNVVDTSLPSADLTRLTEEIDINVSGPIRLPSALIDVLKANKGTIINVSSGLAWVPLGACPIYSATKAAMHSYTVCLRLQLADAGVHVVELAPPLVKTNLGGSEG